MRLELQQVNFSIDGQPILRDMTLPEIDTRALALIGPSGGGKSTLLRLLGGLRVPDRGGILLNGAPLPRSESALRGHRRRVGMVFQNWNLFHHLTARDNITLPLVQVQGLAKREAESRADHLLDRFGLSEHAGKKPGELSGGQQQRVALVRARALRPEVLLLDEPTSALDPEMAAQVLDLVAEVAEEGLPVVLVTHHLAFARRAADTIAYLAEGQMRTHAPTGEFFDNPGLPECQRFLSRVMAI